MNWKPYKQGHLAKSLDACERRSQRHPATRVEIPINTLMTGSRCSRECSQRPNSVRRGRSVDLITTVYGRGPSASLMCLASFSTRFGTPSLISLIACRRSRHSYSPFLIYSEASFAFCSMSLPVWIRHPLGMEKGNRARREGIFRS